MSEFSKLNGYDVKDRTARQSINNLNNGINNLNNRINNIYVDSVSDMKLLTTLVDGDIVVTAGYYEVNDGGSAIYKIVNQTENNVYYEELANNLYAELIITDSINVKQFGAYGDGENDDSLAFQTAVDYCGSLGAQVSPSLNISTPTFFIPSGKYKILTPINIGLYSMTIKGEQSILFGDGTNNCFEFDEYCCHPLYLEEVIFEDFDTAVHIEALNIDKSRSKISKCKFWNCKTCIYNDNQSSLLNITDCTFAKSNKILNNKNGDSVVFRSCWFGDSIYTVDEDVSFIHDSGTLHFEDCMFIPNGTQQVANKIAWIEMTNSEYEKRLYINNCRISAETGYKCLVNYKQSRKESGSPGTYCIKISNCPMISAPPIIRLFEMINNVLIENNNFNAIGNKIIEVDSSLTIDENSYGGLANGFMYDNRIIIKGNHSINQNEFNNYPEALVDITESDFDLTKNGSTVPFYIGNFSEQADPITKRQTYLVKGRYWLGASGQAGHRHFIGLVHLYSSGGNLKVQYTNLSNDNTSLTVSASLSGIEKTGGTTTNYTDVNQIYLNGTSHYLATFINIKSNYQSDISLKRI